MIKFKIKLEDLFNKIGPKNSKSELSNDIRSINPPFNININTPDNGFVPIKEFIIKKVDSYKVKLSNGHTFNTALNHTMLTSNGKKQIKNITSDDILKDDVYIKQITPFKKDDYLYDISISYPHLFKDSHSLTHHNSLILTYIWKTLYECSKISNVILVVPTINLVTQFKSDMIDYGIDENIIGEVYSDSKEWDKQIVISTWQTLSNNLEKLEFYDCIFIDEVHQCKAVKLNEILKECSHMLYKIGCTGTLPNNRLDNLTIKSFLGPVVKTFPVSYLIAKGWLAECNVKRYNLYYNEEIKGKYNEVKDEVFGKQFRLSTISNIVKSIGDENIVLLVGKIKKEGEILEDYLKSCPEFADHQIKFIYRKTKPVEREEWRQKCINEKKVIIIAVYQLYQLGINIPNLNHIGIASSSKGKIRVLQSIGRSLRKWGDGKAYIYDIIDHSNKFLPKHADIRLEYYEEAEFNIFDYELKE